MGPVGMASAERDISSGDSIGWAEHGGLCEYVFHSIDCSVFSGFSVSLEIRHLLGICWSDFHHDLLYILPLAGDEAGPDRGDSFAVAKSLVLEEILRA